MPFNHPILDIIGGLKKGQVRFIRSRLPNKQLQLFDFFSARKKMIPKEKIQEEIETTAFGLNALILDLEKAVVSLIGEYAQSKRPNGEIQKLIELGHGYLEIQDWQKALETLDQARSKAIKIADHGTALQIVQLIRTYLPQADQVSHIDYRMDPLVISEVGYFLQAQEQLRLIKRLPYSERHKQTLLFLQNLILPEVNLDSQISYYGILVMGHALIDQFQEAIQSFETLLKVLKGNVDLLYNPSVLSLSLSSAIIASSSALCREESLQGMQLVRQLSQLLASLNIPEPDRMRIHKLYMDTMEGRSNQTLATLHEKAAKIELEIKNSQGKDLSFHFRLKYEIAVQFLHMREFNQCLIWLKGLLKGKSTAAKALWIINASILALIPLIELGDYEALMPAFRRTSYAISKIKPKSLTAKALLKLINTASSSERGRQKAAMDFLLEYDHLAEEAKNLDLVAIEEIRHWAKSSTIS